MLVYTFTLVGGCADNMKIVYVTLPLNPLPQEGDLPSLRSKSVSVYLVVFVYSFSLVSGCADNMKIVYVTISATFTNIDIFGSLSNIL